MWIITFALFAAYAVLSGATDICDKPRQDVCFAPQIEPVPFPDSAEVLDKICPIITTSLSCLLDYKNKCGADNKGGFDDTLEQMNELVSDACDKDSELHNELSISLPCLKKIVMSHVNSCRPIVEEAMEAFTSRILLGRDDSDSADDEARDGKKYICLDEALHVACLVADAGVTCGTETKELVGRIVDRAGYLDNVCDADIRDEIKEMVAVIQVEFEEGLALKNTVFND